MYKWEHLNGLDNLRGINDRALLDSRIRWDNYIAVAQQAFGAMGRTLAKAERGVARESRSKDKDVGGPQVHASYLS